MIADIGRSQLDRTRGNRPPCHFWLAARPPRQARTAEKDTRIQRQCCSPHPPNYKAGIFVRLLTGLSWWICKIREGVESYGVVPTQSDCPGRQLKPGQLEQDMGGQALLRAKITVTRGTVALADCRILSVNC